MQDLTTPVSKGVNLNFNMLNLVVSVHTAVGEDKSASMHNVCVNDHPATRTKQKLTCPTCEAARLAAVDVAVKNGDLDDVIAQVKKVAAGDDQKAFVKARQQGPALVVIPAETLEEQMAANLSYKGGMQITAHPAAEVTAVLLPSGKSYYLSMVDPLPGAVLTYRTLAYMVANRPDVAFMTKMTLRSAVSLFQLTVAGDGTLALRQMADAELVRKHPVLPIAPDLGAGAHELANLIIEQGVTPFVETEHGTGARKIIAAYAMDALEAAPVVEAGIDTSSIGTVQDFTAHLAAIVKANEAKNAPAATPIKKKAAAKAPRPRKSVQSKVAS